MNNYTENPEQTVFPEIDHVYHRWKKRSELKPQEQMRMYQAISVNYCVGKSIIDVGCGIGIGTYKLSWDALGVYGVDNNQESIAIAKQLYEGPRVKFDVFDLVNPPDRPIATFDVVVCIEVIEHINDYDKALQSLKRFYDQKRRTTFFISSPNRNNPRLSDTQPKNNFHVREWTAGEFYEVLNKHFQSVTLFSGPKLMNFTQDETVDGNTQHSPILAKCEMPI